MKSATQSKFTLDTGSLVLGIALLVFLLLSVASFVYMDFQAGFDKEYLKLASEQRVLTQNIVANARESANTNNPIIATGG